MGRQEKPTKTSSDGIFKKQQIFETDGQDWEPLGHWSKDQREKRAKREDIQSPGFEWMQRDRADVFWRKTWTNRSPGLGPVVCCSRQRKPKSSLGKKYIPMIGAFTTTPSVLHNRLCENAIPSHDTSVFKYSKQGPIESTLKTTLLAPENPRTTPSNNSGTAESLLERFFSEHISALRNQNQDLSKTEMH